MALKKLTVDQNCQLKQWAGDTAAELIDTLMDDSAKASASIEALEAVAGVDLPEEAGTYYLTVTIAEDADPVFAWTAIANDTQPNE